jgi:hypothetical protein
VVPELNTGQMLLMLLRHAFPDAASRFIGYNRIKGIPFFVADIRHAIEEVL